MSTRVSGRDIDSSFLPEFCGIGMVFPVVVIGELLAFLLVLAASGERVDPWSDLALISLFIQWVGLSSLAVLCISRRALSRLTDSLAGVICYVLILLVTLLLSEATYWLVERHFVEPRLDASLQGWQGLYDLARHGAFSGDASSATRHWRFVLRNMGVAAMVGALALRYFYVQHRWRCNLESEANARIQALQSRIRPHFLFNCMNTIASLTRTRPAVAEQIVEDLADLFRASLGDASVPVTLAREFEVCREYLRIEEVRLGARLKVDWHIAALPQDALLPALILQPLIENAVYHGIEPSPNGGEICINGERDGDYLVVDIRNSLSPQSRASHREGNRMAQDNVAQRLPAFFGPRAALHVDAGDDAYCLRIGFPYLREEA